VAQTTAGGQRRKHRADLDGELARGHQDKRLNARRARVEALDERQDKRERLT